MLEQMDVTESSWPGPGFMEPMFPPTPTPAPMPSMPMEESRPSSKPKAKKKKKAGKKEKGNQEETPPLAQLAMTPAGASRRDAPAGHVRETIMRGAWYVVPVSLVIACSAPKIPLGNPPQEIGAMLQRSASDWNRG